MDSQPASASPELDVIIVNWNSAAFLRDCLKSLQQQPERLAFAVTVVDNASTQDGIEQLCSEFPSVRVIRNSVNAGFARANNIGALSTTAPYLLFLNPDTVVQGTALLEMVSVFKTHADAGIVGCRLLNSDMSLQFSCVQRYPRVLNQCLSADILYRNIPSLPLWGLAALFGEHMLPQKVEVVSGACLMIRRDVFQSVGMFNESYFMYSEDVDLCYQAARAAFSCYYLGSASVIHHGGGSSRHRPVRNWAAVAQCGAKFHFVRKTRGKAYGNLYRLAMSANAATRWLLLSAAARYRTASARKWAAIFRWSLSPDAVLRQLTMAQNR